MKKLIVDNRSSVAPIANIAKITAIAFITMWCLGYAQAADKAAARPTAPAKDEIYPAFKLDAGKGYTVCEAYFKHLKARSPLRDGEFSCGIWLDPQRNDFVRPRWEALDVLAHMDIVHNIEGLNLVKEPGRIWDSWLKDFPKLKGEPPMPSPEEADWRARYIDLVKRGKISPQLLQTRMASCPDCPKEAVLAYSRFRTDQCRPFPIWDGTDVLDVGFHHYLLNEDGKRVAPAFRGFIGTAHPADILFFKGKPFLIANYDEPSINPSLGVEVWAVVNPLSNVREFGALPRCTVSYYKHKPIRYGRLKGPGSN